MNGHLEYGIPGQARYSIEWVAEKGNLSWIDLSYFPLTMGITETQKSRTIVPETGVPPCLLPKRVQNQVPNPKMDLARLLVLKKINGVRISRTTTGPRRRLRFAAWFAEGDDGAREILAYLNGRNDEEEDEEDSEEPEFKFSKKEALDAVAFLQKIAHHRPDLDVALPLA
ncbi:hypothetical protein K438DRAFT_1751092 [Mycena galopus ATCC 62051]|nr:hypothetical protein K438DRAFT_1751092 [Mycena galopus ATCC 62051]